MGKDLTLLDHLEELRKRLIFCLSFLVIGFFISFLWVDYIRAFLMKPAGNITLIYTSPPEALMANIRLSLLSGIIISMPIFIYQLLAFIMPGLYKNEKKVIIPASLFMMFLFLLGTSFAYYIVMPFAITFFLAFATTEVMAMFTITNYISFVMNFLLTFGLVFQLPLLFWILGSIEVVSARYLRRNRKFAIIIIIVLAAIITPPDVISQIMIAIPLMLLYEVGIILVMISQRKKKKHV